MDTKQDRPRFWVWGDPITVRNPIRERWEAAQKAKAQPKLDARMAYWQEHGCWPPKGWTPEEDER